MYNHWYHLSWIGGKQNLVQVSEQEKEKMLKLADGTAIGINMIETNYTCLSKWYITPIKAYKYQKEKTR